MRCYDMVEGCAVSLWMGRDQAKAALGLSLHGQVYAMYPLLSVSWLFFFILFRNILKMNPNNTDLERVSNSSAESLSPPFRSVHVSFIAGSSDSLDSDTQTGSDGSKWPLDVGEVVLPFFVRAAFSEQGSCGRNRFVPPATFHLYASPALLPLDAFKMNMAVRSTSWAFFCFI